MALGEIDTENPYYSTTRNWILQRLDSQLPNSGTVIDSIHNKQKFLSLTGVDQAYLQKQWDSGSRFTTCTGFLSVLWSGASAAGGSSRKLRPFEMFKHPGWHWYGDDEYSPTPGDFYMLGVRGGATQHVGVIVDIDDETWTTVDAGQGGRNMGYDCIKRQGPRSFPPGSFAGWLDIDEFGG